MPPSLPFHVKPRQETRDVGSPDIGVLRLPVFRSLTLAERIQVREVDRSDDLFKATAELVITITDRQAPDPLPDGYDRQAEITRHYAALTRILGSMGGAAVNLEPSEAIISVLFAEEIRELQRQSEANEEAKIVRACTAILSSRLEECADWTDDDTRTLPEDLISAIFAFFQAEQAHLAEPIDVAQQQKALEAALGELRPADGSRPPNPTGGPSSGASGMPSPAVMSSAPSDSGSSPSATSSKPAKPRRRSNGADSITTSCP
jgi:hypothetical protein